MLRASLAVGSALYAVRAGAPAPTVISALDQADAAVRDLPTGVLTEALGGVLDEIEQCRRAGDKTSPGLELAVQAAVVALAVQPLDNADGPDPDA